MRQVETLDIIPKGFDVSLRTCIHGIEPFANAGVTLKCSAKQ